MSIKSQARKFILGIARQSTRISPKLNTYIIYYLHFKRMWKPNNPITLNDKILWLKYHTYYNDPRIKRCADKFEVRGYIEEQGMSELLNALIAVYDDPDKVDFDSLPNQFAMKLNIGCRCNIICHDKRLLDRKSAVSKFKTWMKEEYYLSYAEMQYKDVKPLILIEKYLGNEDGALPEDYKFYCLNGKSKYVMICVDREIGQSAKFFYFDREWNMLPFTRDALEHPNIVIPKPDNIDLAFDYAEKLAKDFPFVRVDLYIVGGKVLFGELTFTPSAGLDAGRLKETDLLLGKELILPKE